MQQGATALHLASYEGHLIVVYLLLNYGATVMVVDRKGNTPLHDAASGGHAIVMHRLLRHGADLTFRNQVRSLTHNHTFLTHSACVV